jgi:ketosteroid isomerase-like protein
MRAIWDRYLETGEPDFSTMDTGLEITDHDIPEGGTYRGHDGFVRWMSEATGVWEEFKITPVEYVDAGSSVVVFLDYMVKGSGSGLRLEREDAIVYEVRGGKIVRMDYFNDRDQALAFAGVQR